MKRAVLALLVLTGCNAQSAPRQWVKQPPENYQENTTATVEFVSPNEVQAVCLAKGAQRPQGRTILGCERDGVITVPNPCSLGPDGYFRDLLCHEMAHVNGWTHPSDPWSD